MAVSIKSIAIIMAALGVKAFVFGILAEIKKPASGEAIMSNGVVTCKYPSDPSVFFGFLSIALLIACTLVGICSVFYPYEGRSVPCKGLFDSTRMVVFFQIALLVSMLAGGMLLWATTTELIHLTKNVHRHNLNSSPKCPTAKTGLFGGGAFLALDASLFWLVCLMLTSNAREDYFDEAGEDQKGEFGQVLITDYETKEEGKA
ncbi:hypothetical protein SADUNF_Sadunf07G0002700 [Salix dunnii]|uniref:Uncharacterized protein n=1 Tax=Salix dunnii TaxID=1413687 RepID=A0A835MTC2_9ROSI|nr:hypothetical protein SADUNF_Sadunf07G0002700 [Salix dunnii]